MPAKKKLNSISSLLAAAVMGWSEALGRHDKDIEYKVENVEQLKKQTEKVRSDAYSGLIQNLRRDDLLGTGTLFRGYCPYIYKPNVERISVENVTDRIDTGLRSGFFHLYRLRNPASDLKPLSPILFPHGQNLGEIVTRLNSIDDKTLQFLSTQVLNGLSPSTPFGSFEHNLTRPLRTILEANQEEFRHKLFEEVHAIRADVKKLQASVAMFKEQKLVALPNKADTLTGWLELSEVLKGTIGDAIKTGVLEALRQHEKEKTKPYDVILDSSKEAVKDLLKDKQKEVIEHVVLKSAKYFAREIIPALWGTAKLFLSS